MDPWGGRQSNKGNDSFAGMFFDWTNLTLNYWLMLRLYIIYIWYILRIKTIYECKAMKVVRDVVRPTWDESPWLDKCIVPGFLFVFIDFSFASALQRTQKPRTSLWSGRSWGLLTCMTSSSTADLLPTPSSPPLYFPPVRLPLSQISLLL